MHCLNLPPWSRYLCNYYVIIRIEGRNKTIRRRYYRAVEKEKFRLACLGINQVQILAVCRYLSKMTNARCRKLKALLNEPITQLTLDFT